MALASTILAAISAVAALATVWLAYLALRKAKETVDEAKAARQDAEQAAKDAAAERHAAAEDRRQAAEDRRQEAWDQQRRRIERIGEIVEDIFWAADLARQGDANVAGKEWRENRNLLGHALVGLHNQLPQTAAILNCAHGAQAFGAASEARKEVELELKRLDGESVGMPPMPRKRRPSY